MKHLDPRQMPEWLQLEIEQHEAARRRHGRNRLLAAAVSGLFAAAILWSFGAYNGLWQGAPIEASR